PPSSPFHAPFDTVAGERVHTIYKDGQWYWYFYPEKEKKRWLKDFGFRRRLSIVIWAVCMMGLFLPTTYWISFSGRTSLGRVGPTPSVSARLIGGTIAVIMIWVGARMSNDDGLDTRWGELGSETLGYVLEVFAWLYLVSLLSNVLFGLLMLVSV
ncbi:MAG TPA: hypothetical protein VJT71_19645, partial [Pyrinomonadaceae bacterium]|nr:hypothetical protein [Pyrinomonadaceae bacterium]